MNEPEATLSAHAVVGSPSGAGAAPEPATGLPALTVFDRCDAPDCTSQAYVRALLPSGRSLVFCGHHGHALLPALAAQGAVIRDDSHLLIEARLGSTAGEATPKE